jgi:glutamate synthase (NADPH/NADH) small chain
MGKVTGFIEFQRLQEAAEDSRSRVNHYKEFVMHLTTSRPSQQGARCMDCGIPFCQNGCPVNNIIPDWNDLVYNGHWQAGARDPALDQQLPRVHRPHLPGALRGRVHAEHQQRPGGHQVDRARDHRQGLGDGLGAAAAARGQDRQEDRGGRVRPGRAGLRAATGAGGHDVTVFEKNDRIGGLLRYGIPDFKMEKSTSTAASSRCRPKA